MCIKELWYNIYDLFKLCKRYIEKIFDEIFNEEENKKSEYTFIIDTEPEYDYVDELL